MQKKYFFHLQRIKQCFTKSAIFTIIVTLIGISLVAQQPGSPIRVKLEDGKILEGEFLRISGQNLELTGITNETFEIPLYMIEQIEFLQNILPTRIQNPEESNNSALQISVETKLDSVNSLKMFEIINDEKINLSTSNKQKKSNSDLTKIQKIKKGRIGVGFGTSYGAIGINVTTIGKTIKVSAGAGYFPASMIFTRILKDENRNFYNDSFLFNGGLKAYFDKKHQIYIHAQYGHFGLQAKKTEIILNNYKYIFTKQYKLTGITLLTGFDLPLGKTFGINIACGVSKNLSKERLIELEYALASDFGFIIKF